MEVHTEDLRLTNDDLRFENSAPAAQVPVMNSGTEVSCSDGVVANANSDLEVGADGEPPLTEDELAAFAALREPNRERMDQHRAEVEQALRAGADLDAGRRRR